MNLAKKIASLDTDNDGMIPLSFAHRYADTYDNHFREFFKAHQEAFRILRDKSKSAELRIAEIDEIMTANVLYVAICIGPTSEES